MNSNWPSKFLLHHHHRLRLGAEVLRVHPWDETRAVRDDEDVVGSLLGQKNRDMAHPSDRRRAVDAGKEAYFQAHWGIDAAAVAGADTDAVGDGSAGCEAEGAESHCTWEF